MPVDSEAAPAEIEQVLPDLTGDEVPNVDQYVLHFFFCGFNRDLGMLLGFFLMLCK